MCIGFVVRATGAYICLLFPLSPPLSSSPPSPCGFSAPRSDARGALNLHRDHRHSRHRDAGGEKGRRRKKQLVLSLVPHSLNTFCHRTASAEWYTFLIPPAFLFFAYSSLAMWVTHFHGNIFVFFSALVLLHIFYQATLYTVLLNSKNHFIR